MSTLAANLTPVQQAAEAARSAALRTGIQIRDLVGVDETDAASALVARVWDADGNAILPANLARAMSHAGSLVAGGFADDKLAGAVIGFVGFAGGMHLHSHLLAAVPSAGRPGIGTALKQYQRYWALSRGLNWVSWTFDPLVRRNAYLNLSKLGAEIEGYEINFYGAMIDSVNSGDETDRAVVRWNLNSVKAVEASEGKSAQPDVDRILAGGGTIALDENSEGAPILSDVTGDAVLCRIPEDIVSIRKSNPELAHEWRSALRQTLGRALNDGYIATGITKSGWYVLQRGGTRIK